jgi:hypothetical protein
MVRCDSNFDGALCRYDFAYLVAEFLGELRKTRRPTLEEKLDRRRRRAERLRAEERRKENDRPKAAAGEDAGGADAAYLSRFHADDRGAIRDSKAAFTAEARGGGLALRGLALREAAWDRHVARVSAIVAGRKARDRAAAARARAAAAPPVPRPSPGVARAAV